MGRLMVSFSYRKRLNESLANSSAAAFTEVERKGYHQLKTVADKPEEMGD